jgi:hypothetical protein
VHPEVEPLVGALYASRRPVNGLQDQLIHGDLNPENILVGPGLPPGFLDLAPFWRPPEFALALFANWIGPRRGDPAVLRHFAEVRHFDRLLIRAGIRMLLIMTDIDGFEASPEARAARVILDHVGGDQPRITIVGWPWHPSLGTRALPSAKGTSSLGLESRLALSIQRDTPRRIDHQQAFAGVQYDPGGCPTDLP